MCSVKTAGTSYRDENMHCDSELQGRFLPQIHRIPLRDQLVLGSCIIRYQKQNNTYSQSVLLKEQDHKSVVAYACIFVSYSQWEADNTEVKEPRCMEAAAGLSEYSLRRVRSPLVELTPQQNILCWLSDCCTILGHCHRCVTTRWTCESYRRS